MIAVCLAGLMATLFSTGPAHDPLLDVLEAEVKREIEVLKKNDPPVYYIAYRVEDTDSLSLESTLGKLTDLNADRSRRFAQDLRVGSPKLDNTHEIKGRYDWRSYMSQNPEYLPYQTDAELIRRELWRLTHETVGQAVERYNKVTTNESVMAEAEDRSDDFLMTDPCVDIQSVPELKMDRDRWEQTINKMSRIFQEYPDILHSSVSVSGVRTVKHFVDSSGAKLKHGITMVRLFISAQTRSDDGMPLMLHDSFHGFQPDDLPSEEELVKSARVLAEKLTALRTAPAVEPYLGPAIMMNEAAAVFFHEVMGHRLEGHRQKSEKEGQTFTRKVGEEVLPDFMSLVDDPAMSHFGEEALLGYYEYDDEGVKGQKTVLVEKGILRGFLMNRSPIEGFSSSNGHGRGQLGLRTVARQGNLKVTASETVPYEQLKMMLLEECRKQEKPYGLIFADISGGFTSTGRGGVQSFKVIPLEVYRVYTDGRPDELVRGVDIVGTPLAALEKILAAADDDAVFNGFCGAESGSVPVSAVAPSLLVGEIEVEKKSKDMRKPPILPSPLEGGES